MIKTRNIPALVVVVTTVLLLACTAAAQTPQNPIKLFSATPDTNNTTDSAGTSKGTFTVDLSCPTEPTGTLSSTADGNGKVFTDNWISLQGSHNFEGTANVCYGGFRNSTDPSNQSSLNSPATDCFSGPPHDYTGFGGTAAALGTFIDPSMWGVGPLDISSYLAEGDNHLQFDLINDGGPYGNSDVYLITSCSQTPAQTEITKNTPPGETTTFNFGPFQQKVTPDASQPDLSLTITATPEPANFSLGPNFPGASCVQYQQTGGSGPDQCWLLQISCNGGSCPSDPTQINALLANSFDTSTPIASGPGFLKTEACDPSSGGCVFTSNQISEYHANAHDPVVKGKTSPPGGYSYWMVTQNTPNNPLVTITSPTATTYTQGQAVASAYSCTPANPVTTSIASCTGPVPSGQNIDTSTLGPHSFTVTAHDMLTNDPICVFDSTVGITTTPIPGCPTGSELGTRTVTYNVIGPAADVFIAKVGPSKVKKNTNFAYAIAVTNIGQNSNPTSGPVTVTDVVPAGLTIVGTPKGIQGSCSIVSVHGHPTLSCTSTSFNCSVSGQTVTCTLPNSLQPFRLSSINGAAIGITVKGPVGMYINTATVNYSNDSNTSNNTSQQVKTTITN